MTRSLILVPVFAALVTAGLAAPAAATSVDTCWGTTQDCPTDDSGCDVVSYASGEHRNLGDYSYYVCVTA